MGESFIVNHDRLPADLAGPLDRHRNIHSGETFNAYCREACRFWRERCGGNFVAPSAEFSDLLDRIARRENNTISTGWGGVVVTLHEAPRVEKFLVVRRGGYLALEKHAEKDEHLEVREGAGLLLWRQTPGGPLVAEALTPGSRFHFVPGVEHCLIGTDNLLVFERSTDPKGMDQDLIFLYEPDAA